jgi:hypothetical protein
MTDPGRAARLPGRAKESTMIVTTMFGEKIDLAEVARMEDAWGSVSVPEPLVHVEFNDGSWRDFADPDGSLLWRLLEADAKP